MIEIRDREQLLREARSHMKYMQMYRGRYAIAGRNAEGWSWTDGFYNADEVVEALQNYTPEQIYNGYILVNRFGQVIADSEAGHCKFMKSAKKIEKFFEDFH